MGNWQIQVASSGSFLDLETSYGFRVQQPLGAGMAPIQNISTSFGLLDGALFQRQRTDVRSMTLVGALKGATVADLHSKRSALIDEVKPDRSASQAPIILRYTGAASTLQASCFYEGGLELGNVDNTTELNIALRFLMYDPYFEKITNSSATLTTQASFTANYVAQRAACGAWGTLGSGFNQTVNSIVAGSDGRLYFGGAFTTASGGTACRVAQYSTAGVFSAVGNAMNSDVVALAVGRDGYLYAGGGFTTASGFAACAVARFSGTAWASMDGGVQHSGGTKNIFDMAVDSDGNIIVGGVFTSLGTGGPATCGIGKWIVSSSAWDDVGGGLKERANTGHANGFGVAVAPNKDIWVCGAFDAAGALAFTACAVAYYSQSGSAWKTVAGSGRAWNGRSVDFTADGTAYLGATGTVASPFLWTSNGISVTSVASYIGTGTAGVQRVYVDKNTNIVFTGGNFYSVNGFSMFGQARVIGNVPTRMDVFPPGGSSAQVLAIHAASTRVLTIGFDQSGTACAAAVTTVTNNGTAAAYPILTACATSSSTSLVQLVNYTTGEAIYFNLPLTPNEIVTVDLRPGQKTVTSNFRGNIINAVLPSSNVATWRLLPGTNNISFWLTGGGGAARLSWVERFWSCDG